MAAHQPSTKRKRVDSMTVVDSWFHRDILISTCFCWSYNMWTWRSLFHLSWDWTCQSTVTTRKGGTWLTDVWTAFLFGSQHGMQELKDELRKMKRKVTGNKIDLQQRLQEVFETNDRGWVRRAFELSPGTYLASGTFRDVYLVTYTKGPRKNQRGVYKLFKNPREEGLIVEDLKAVQEAGRIIKAFNELPDWDSEDDGGADDDVKLYELFMSNFNLTLGSSYLIICTCIYDYTLSIIICIITYIYIHSSFGIRVQLQLAQHTFFCNSMTEYPTTINVSVSLRFAWSDRNLRNTELR